MLEKLAQGSAAVGAKQVLRAVEAGKVARVYVARDAEPFVVKRVLAVCRDKNLPVIEVSSMRELGAACGIEVGAACAALLKP